MKLKELKEYILDLVFKGTISVFRLPEELFLFTYYKLRTGIDVFFRKVDFEHPDWEVKYRLASNIYLFSGAKTYKNIWDLQKAMTKGGKKVSFDEFYQVASQIFDNYNVNWLKTEFDTAYRSAKMANEWRKIERAKDVLPLLRYVTANDERVRPEHQALHGIVRPVDDPFWNDFYPPNGFNCRCWVEQLAEDEATITPLTPEELEEHKKEIDPLFKMNSGRDKYVFSPRHKYFNANTLPPKLREHFKVQRSKKFGFDIPLFKKKN